MGSLFQSQPSLSYTSPAAGLPDYLQNYLRTSSNWLASQVGLPAPAYTGPLTAGLSDAQQKALGDTANIEPLAMGGTVAGLGGLEKTALGGNDPLNNPDIISTVKALSDLTGQNIDRAMGSINATAASLGQGTGTPLLDSYNRMLSEILPGFVSTAGGLLTNATEQNWQNETAAQNSLMNFGPQMLQQLMAGGTTAQNTAQNLFTTSYQDWLRQLQGEWQAAPVGVSTVSPLAAPQPVTYNPPPIAGILSGAASVFGPKIFGSLGA